MQDIRSFKQEIRTTCLKCGKPIEVARYYCKECKKQMKRRRELPWLARTLLWIVFVTLCAALFLVAENTTWMRQTLRAVGW